MTITLPNAYSEAGAELRMASKVFPESKMETVSQGKTSLSEQRSTKGEARLIERMAPRMKEELESLDPSLRDAIFRYYEAKATSLQLALKFLEYLRWSPLFGQVLG